MEQYVPTAPYRRLISQFVVAMAALAGKIRVGGKNTAVGVRTGGDGAIHSDAAGARCK